VSYRADGGYINDVSPITRLITYPDSNQYTAVAGKIAFAYTPNDSLTIIPAVTYQHDFDADEPYSTPPVPIQGTHPSQLTTSFLSPFQNETYEREPSDDRMTLATLTIEKHFSAVDITSVTGYLKRQFFELTDVTPYVLGAFQGSNLYTAFSNLLTPSYAYDSTKSLTQEIRVSSRDRASALKWTGGLFYSSQSFRFYQPVVTPGLTQNLVAEYGPGTTLQTLEPSALPNDTVFLGDTTSTIEEYAAFGEASYNLTDALQLTLGARAFQLREGLLRSAEGFFNGGFSSDHPPDVNFNGVDPRLILDYKISRDNLIYVSAAEGFRPGLVNVSIPLDVCKSDLAALHLTAPPPGAKPDSLWNFELGSKNTLLDGRLRVNSAVYQENWKDIQLAVQLPTCGFSFNANVGQARIRGGELAIDAEPILGLTIGASATYLNAVITEAVPDVVYRTGDELPNTPRQWYTAYTEYEHAITPTVQGFVRADYQRRGDAVRDPSAQSYYSNYVYHGWDVANINFGATQGPWTARLFVNNIFNRDPPIDYTIIWSAWRTSTLRPRTLGLNIGRSF
jgi:iron complex outermembrane recepter protein